jgi:hypothetical protein
MNDFARDLEFSYAANAEPFWDAIYRKAFPDMVMHMATQADSQSQRLGIDRVIHLASGRSIYVDEKKRRGFYSDILLEFISNDRTGARGWMEKDLLIDYLAYAFTDRGIAYIYPWLALRRVWRESGPRWKQQYPLIKAANQGYSTHSVAVPTAVLNEQIRNAIMVAPGKPQPIAR